MELLTRDLELALPPIHSDAVVAQVKFFTPWTQWTWYAAEASAELADGSEVSLQDPRAEDRVDVIFFGLVYGLEKEYGYWRLSELTEIRGPVGLRIERDLYFTPTPLEECKDPTRLHS
ncbi:MAG: DUF2958 domain-containing protein [Dehalococcoidia bacterium]|nr:DUF2958 domain-containing protein [Dehalococcoidia bacterium]